MENELFNSLLDRGAHRGCQRCCVHQSASFIREWEIFSTDQFLQQIRGTQSHNSRVVVCSAFDDAEIFGGGKGI